MPSYLSPGVYVEEVDSGNKPIEGVSTSTVGFVGMTVRGPVYDSASPANLVLPLLVTSFPDFTRQFGGYLPATLGDSRFLAYAVQGFFDNQGERAYIVRVQHWDAAAAISGASLRGGMITRLRQDVLSNATSARLATLRGIMLVPTATKLTFTQVKNGITTTQTVTVTAYNDATGTVTWAAVDKLNSSYEARYTSVATDYADPGTPVAITARDKGAWGNAIDVQVFAAQLARAQVNPPLVESVAASGNFDVVPLSTTNNFYVGAIVEFNLGSSKVYGKIKAIQGNSIILNTPFTGAGAANALDPMGGFTTTAGTAEFRLTASYGGVTEDYPTLTLDSTTPYYYATALNESTLISVAGTSDNTVENPFRMPAATDGLHVLMVGGSDGTPADDADYIGTDNGPGQRTGIEALEDIETISIIAAPGKTSQDVQNALITQCETLHYRFAILDPAPNSSLDAIQNQRNLYDTNYAALYYPCLKMYDPLIQADITAPPSGHIAGIYARVDETRGVYKAPANEVIANIDDLEMKINKGEQDILNPSPNNINVLRDFREHGRGLRVYGARCTTSDSDWIYINVRRLFIFLEASLDLGTQWAVFEPNDEKLWARLRQSVSAFLTDVWRDGALMGLKAEQAFFVRCDRTTMSQADIDNGRLIMLIGVAPVKPAEFVILRIGQWSGGSAVQEL